MCKYKVKNVIGSSDDKIPEGYKSWIDYWKGKSNQQAEKCKYVNCRQTQDIVGAHVSIVGDPECIEYIVPLCNTHNHPAVEDAFYVFGPLVCVRDGSIKIKPEGSFFDGMKEIKND
jgi:hypothetical protein